MLIFPPGSPRRRPSALRVFFPALLLVLATVSAQAKQDVVHFGNSIEVAPETSVQDAVCLFCSVHAQGKVQGDLVVIFGSAEIDSQANHDVVVLFGDMTAGPHATIGGDMVNLFGSTRLGNQARIGKDAVSLFGSYRSGDSVEIGGDQVVQPGWIFWLPFAILVAIVLFAIQQMRRARMRRMLMGQWR